MKTTNPRKTSVSAAQSPKLIFCFGPGGAGKTTIAASLALAYAQQGKRVCCITIDPSKRLVRALGMKPPYSVDPAPVNLAGHPDIHFDALVIRVEPLLQRLVQESVPAHAQKILSSHIYQVLVSEVQGLEHYMAIDVLQRIYHGEKHDVVIVDTPPTRHAINFLEAPERLFGILNQQFFKFFVHGYGSIGKGSLFFVKDIYHLGSRLLEKFFGMTFLNELADFFGYFEDALEELRDRIQTTLTWMQSPATGCVLIGYEYVQHSEMNYYLEHIVQYGISRQGFVFNQSLANTQLGQDRVKKSDAPWIRAIEQRIQVQKKTLLEYQKWAEDENMPFLEIPLVLETSKPQEIIQATAAVIQQDQAFLKAL